MSRTSIDPATAPWRTSSYSANQNSACVEVAPVTGVVGVRDSKARAAGHLAISRAAWRAFVENIKRG